MPLRRSPPRSSVLPGTALGGCSAWWVTAIELQSLGCGGCRRAELDVTSQWACREAGCCGVDGSLSCVREAITSGIIGAAIAIALTIVAQQFAQRSEHRQWLRGRRAEAVEVFYRALHTVQQDLRDLVRTEYWAEAGYVRPGRDRLHQHRRTLRDLASNLDLLCSTQVRAAAEQTIERFDMCVGCYTGDKVFSDKPTVAIVDDMGRFIGGEQSMIFDTSIESVDRETEQLADSIVDFQSCARSELGSASRWYQQPPVF